MFFFFFFRVCRLACAFPTQCCACDFLSYTTTKHAQERFAQPTALIERSTESIVKRPSRKRWWSGGRELAGDGQSRLRQNPIRSTGDDTVVFIPMCQNQLYFLPRYLCRSSSFLDHTDWGLSSRGTRQCSENGEAGDPLTLYRGAR